MSPYRDQASEPTDAPQDSPRVSWSQRLRQLCCACTNLWEQPLTYAVMLGHREIVWAERRPMADMDRWAFVWVKRVDVFHCLDCGRVREVEREPEYHDNLTCSCVCCVGWRGHYLGKERAYGDQGAASL